MFLKKNPAFARELSERHFGHWTPNSGPKSGWNKDLGGEIHAEMGTIVSHPPKPPFCGREGFSWVSVLHKMSFIKAKGQSKSDETTLEGRKSFGPTKIP